MRKSAHYWLCYQNHWTIGRFHAEVENAGQLGWWLLPGFPGYFADSYFSIIIERPVLIPLSAIANLKDLECPITKNQ